MTNIVNSVRRVSDIIARISEAAAEQTRGIGQINGAVGGLEQMTQQNAALVEQSAAAAEILRDQAWPLDAVVQHFTLADASDSARAHNGWGADAGSAAAAQSDWKLIAKAS